MKKNIELVGPETISLITLDGGSDWVATKPMIQEVYPWIFFKYCTSHGTTLIIKDCFKQDGGIPDLVELNEFITDAQHWFSSHACSSFIKQMAIGTEAKSFIWPAVTRYCGVLLKIKRFRSMRELLRRVVSSGVYREKNFVEDPFPAKLLGAEVWDLMDRVIKILGPILLLCRLADGQKPVISKLYGTQLYVRKCIETAAATAGPDTMEAKVRDIFLERWPDMQSDIVSATYLLDPLFVDNSKTAANCTVTFWIVARKVYCVCVYVFALALTPIPTPNQVLRVDDDNEWNALHAKMARQLTKFQAKGGDLPHMSSPAAWINLHSKCALEWWSTWGQEVPELQQLAIKIVPLIIGSGPAERTWKDVDAILTKKRNRMSVQTCMDILYVRTWLRRKLKLVSDEELELFKEWETELFHGAEYYDGEVEPSEGLPKEKRIFEDRIENWEMNAVDGSGPGVSIPLGQVRRDNAAKFRLQEKYKGVYFLDKDPAGMYSCPHVYNQYTLMYTHSHR